MANTIKIKNSGNTATAPSTLEFGELALNYADGKIFYKNNSNTISSFNASSVLIADSPPSSAEEGDLWFESDTGSIFVYYDSSWVEMGGTSAGGSTTIDTIDDISDVTITSPLQFQGLLYDGENWVNSSIPNVYLVRNNTGSTLLKGTLVSASGAEPSGRINVEPFEVTGLENSELRVMGFVTNNISNGVNGEVMSFGTLTGIDTRGSTQSALAVGDETWAAGDILYAHPTADGKLTNVKPQHDLAVAFITVRHASSGQIAIRIVPGNNHLEWMHDVSINTPSSGQYLKWNGTTWVNETMDLGSDTTFNELERKVRNQMIYLICEVGP